ncbi:hypothetical protein GCM10009736_10840 [Actinomadura bangladeshensis]
MLVQAEEGRSRRYAEGGGGVRWCPRALRGRASRHGLHVVKYLLTRHLGGCTEVRLRGLRPPCPGWGPV